MSAVDIILIIVFFVNVILSTLVFLYRKESRGSIFFSVAGYSTALWVFAMFLFRDVSDVSILILPTKLLYVAGISIATNFLYFSFTFLEDLVKKRVKLFLFIAVLPIASVVLIAFSESIISNVVILGDGKKAEFGSLYFAYSVLMFSYFIWAYTNLLGRLKKVAPDSIEKTQLLYVIVGTFISVIFGLIYDIVVPYLGNFTFYWLGPVMTIMFVTATSYSIFKHRLFDVRVIVTELLTFAIWIFILARALLATTLQERLINLGLLGFVVAFGILLIKSVLKEVEQKERIEKLAKDLEAANERLKELDQLKSEFVSMATHQIRGPLTTIKGYASMILQGDLGAVPEHLKGTINTIFESSNALTVVVGDFLDISRIEQGRMKYDFTVFDLSKLVQGVGEELAPVVERKGLRIQLQIEPDIIVHADAGKVRQVVGNLIDNAVKYTPQGSVKVKVMRIDGKARLEVSDTGVGIKPETLPKLFQKFSRAEDASKANILGTGLGLYVAKKLIEAQSGTIWAESEGERKGSTFFVELPIKS